MPLRLAALVLLATLAGGCSEPVELPDRSDLAVQAEEQRLATFLESTDDKDIWEPKPRECSVRLLGQEGDTAYVWAFCQGPLDGPERPGSSLPLRIDGDRVSAPRDGSLRGEDIEEMFPADIARAILDGDDRVYP